MNNIETRKENICINKIIGQKKDFVFVQDDTIVPDTKPDILNTISATGNAYIYKKEIVDGKIKLDGTIDVYVIYLADDDVGSIRGINTSVRFSKVIQIDGITPDMTIEEMVQIKTIECNVINGRKIGVKVGIELGATVYTNENIDYVTDVDDKENVQTLVKTFDISSLVGFGNTKTIAKENIQIPEGDNLSDILSVQINITNKDKKISYNKVLAKGDAEVKILYLTESGDIKTVTQNIQIMGFIDMENINEECICNIKYKIKNVLIKPNGSEEHSIYVEIELELICMAYKNLSTSMVQDMYGIRNDIIFNKKTVKVMSKKINLNEEYNLKNNLNIPNNKIYNVNVNPIINNTKVINNRINYEGDVELNFLTLTENNRIENTMKKIPFNFNVDIDEINENTNIVTEIEVLNSSFNILSDGQVDSNIELRFDIDLGVCSTINIIDDINIEETRDISSYSMIIYFVKKGDTLWNIAKKFKTTVQEILNVNEIENENSIVPGQQLFIPKYVCTKKEISA